MKKNIVFIAFSVISLSQAAALDYEYVPLVQEGVKWVYHHYYDESFYGPIPGLTSGDVIATLEIRGDTIINGKTYKAVHKYHSDAINEENDTTPVYLREENKVVYGIMPLGTYGTYPHGNYPDCLIDCGYNDSFILRLILGEEFVLYDFNNPQVYYENLQGDDIMKYGCFSYLYTDTVTIGGRKRACHMFQDNRETSAIIEGIGYASPKAGYTLAYFNDWLMSGPVFFIDDVKENGENIMPSEFVSQQTFDEVLDFATPGMKWVNERVIVNHGDTVCQYYTYRFQEENYSSSSLWNYYNCLYREYDGSEISEDSVIAKLHDCYSLFPRFIDNEAFAKEAAQGRNMIDFTINTADGQFLYLQCNNDMVNLPRYYMARQCEPFLNHENFIEVEPLMIEGVPCSRYAYIGEDGDTLAYVVEGIGFDSRDMGDLLTPFTRKPDPDADYQEWCGLCHVVKDGRIIYKGMRYTPDNMTGIDEVVADRRGRYQDPNYYNMMGQPVGKEVPTTPGIYIHQGKKICVSPMP